MAKIRGIKPETWTDSKFVRLSPLARLLFLGMWNYACDNGHLEDDPVELKIRILPMDACDVTELLDEMLATGQVERTDDYLKVKKLPNHQRIDLRYLTLCEHCEHDVDTVFDPSDKTGSPSRARRAPHVNPKSARRAPEVDSLGAHVDGDGDGDGEKRKETTSPSSEVADAPTDEPRPDVEKICQHMADVVEGNGAKRPAITKRWRESARLLLDRDGHTLEQVLWLIDWTGRDEFWKSNILSVPKLREKFDQLKLKATGGRTAAPSEPVRIDQWRLR